MAVFCKSFKFCLGCRNGLVHLPDLLIEQVTGIYLNVQDSSTISVRDPTLNIDNLETDRVDPDQTAPNEQSDQDQHC